MTRDEHLKVIYITASQKRGKRHGLVMLCGGPDCAGAEMFAPSHKVGDVLAAAEEHIKAVDEESTDEQTVGQAAAVAKLYSLAVLDEARSAAAKFLADLDAIKRRYVRELSAGAGQFSNLLKMAEQVQREDGSS